MRGTERPAPQARRRPPRPPSRSRTRMGGAAGAVLLMVLGTGTLGAFPPADARGRIADTAVVSATPVLPAQPAAPVYAPPVLDPDVGALFGSVGTVTAPAMGTATAVAPVPAAPATAAAPPAAAPPAAGAPAQQVPARFTTSLPDQRAQIAIRTAMVQIGLPYQWGGDGPTNGDSGFDCSGLTTYAYAAASVALPRTAHSQYYTGPHVPLGAALQPGDLVFYGTPAYVHHVGMYLGDGKMVNAPTFGQPVQVAFYRWSGDDYLGATRPAAVGTTTTGLLPYAPAAPPTGAPKPFPAPTAPAPTAVPNVTAPQPGEGTSASAAVEAARSSSAPVTVTVTASATSTAPTSTSTKKPRSSGSTVTTTSAPATTTTKSSGSTATSTAKSTRTTSTRTSTTTVTETPAPTSPDDDS